jgi:phosphate transport system substrate-binding protein
MFVYCAIAVVFLSSAVSGAQAVGSVVGAGATFPARVYTQALEFYNTQDHGYVVSYTGMGSSSGRCRLEDWATECSASDTLEPTIIDYAGSDSIAKPSEYEEFPDVQLYPVLAGAVVPIANIPGGSAILTLHISTAALAMIFRGEITWWNDTRITSTNSENEVALLGENKIAVAVRDGKSGTTEIFKSALSQFDAVFAETTGVSSSTSWVGLSPIYASSMTTTVLTTPYSIGYVVLGEAVAAKVQIASIAVAGGTISATLATISAAVVEKGSAFGNNGDDPVHLTADVSAAYGLNAWPIVGFTYLAMRKDTLREGATCATRLATVDYWNWFLTSSFVEEIAHFEYIVTLPDVTLFPVLDKFRADILCQGSRVYKKIVTIHAPEVMHYMVQNLVVPQYREKFLDVTVEVLPREPGDALELGRGIAMVSTREYLSSLQHQPVKVKSLPYARMSIGVIYNLCDSVNAYCDAEAVEIDFSILANILTGNILTWNDAAVVTKNSWLSAAGDAMSVHLSATNDTVIVELLALLADELGGVDLALRLFTVHDSDEALRLAVLATPYSLGITALFGQLLSSDISVARIENKAHVAVLPSRDGLSACDDQYAPGCYPLHVDMSLLLPTNYAMKDIDSGFTVLLFARWLLSSENFLEFSGGVSIVSLKTSYQKIGDVTSDGVSILQASNSDVFLDPSLNLLGIVLASVLLVGLALLAVGVVIFRNNKIVKNSQPIFMILLLFGLAIMVSSIFPMSIDDESEFDGLYEQRSDLLDSLCMMQVWLYFVGYGVAVSALLVKTYRIMAIFNVTGKTIKRQALTAWDVMPIFVAVNGMVLVLLTGWQLYSPLYWDRVVTSYDYLGYPDASTGGCTTDKPLTFFYLLLVGQMTTYLVGNYLAGQTKDINPKFAESKYITMTMLSGLQTSVLTLPVVFINYDDSDTLYIGKLMNVALQVIALSTFLFIPKVLALIQAKTDSKIGDSSALSTMNSTANRYASNSNVTSEHDAGGTVTGTAFGAAFGATTGTGTEKLYPVPEGEEHATAPISRFILKIIKIHATATAMMVRSAADMGPAGIRGV